MKKTLLTVLLSLSTLSYVHAFDLDMTVDDEIRKNYNSSKLIKDTGMENLENLPDLPQKLQIQTQNNSSIKSSPLPKQIINGNKKISKGTSFDVINLSNISDWQIKGSSVNFKLKSAVKKKKYLLPADTIFKGEIIESHQPQFSGNGGLVVIRINSIVINNEYYPLNAYITKANSKKIFLNNIKGQRTFLKTMWQKGNWGRTLFDKMLTLTLSLGASGSTVVLSPFPLAYGTICLGLNALTSPICAFFTKGGHVSIPEGSAFKVKLLEDSFIN